MAKNRIIPEKITRPFQLMAAWFVMLILLVSALLAGAANIDTPTWIPGFLCISAVLLALLIMTCVFIMLTKFRPHLQEPKEYAEWLKDERRHGGESLAKLEIRDLPELKPQAATIPKPDLADIRLFREIMAHPVSVSFLRNVDQLLSALRKQGFRAELYQDEYRSSGKFESNNDQMAIWIGSRVPPRVALLATKIAVAFWQHLRYMHLSTDGTSDPPDRTHDEIYLGGATSTAREYGLQPWTPQEIQELPEDMTITDFHDLIRSRYAQQGT